MVGFEKGKPWLPDLPVMGGILAVPAAAALQVIVKEGVREIGAQPDLVVVEKTRAEVEPEAGGEEAEVLV